MQATAGSKKQKQGKQGKQGKGEEKGRKSKFARWERRVEKIWKDVQGNQEDTTVTKEEFGGHKNHDWEIIET